MKTLWPVACREYLFLPEFKVQNEELATKYEVISFIAKGSFGTVYKVRKLSDANIYALKVLEKSKVTTATLTLAHNSLIARLIVSQIILDDYQQQLKYEVLIQRAISHHPFITTSFERWQNKGFVYQRKSPIDWQIVLRMRLQNFASFQCRSSSAEVNCYRGSNISPESLCNSTWRSWQ